MAKPRRHILGSLPEGLCGRPRRSSSWLRRWRSRRGKAPPRTALRHSWISDLGATTCGSYAGGGGTLVCSPRHALVNGGLALLGAQVVVGTLLLQPLLPTRASPGRRALLVLAGAALPFVAGFPEDTGKPWHAVAATVHFAAAGLGTLAAGLDSLPSAPGRGGHARTGWSVARRHPADARRSGRRSGRSRRGTSCGLAFYRVDHHHRRPGRRRRALSRYGPAAAERFAARHRRASGILSTGSEPGSAGRRPADPVVTKTCSTPRRGTDDAAYSPWVDRGSGRLRGTARAGSVRLQRIRLQGHRLDDRRASPRRPHRSRPGSVASAIRRRRRSTPSSC